MVEWIVPPQTAKFFFDILTPSPPHTPAVQVKHLNPGEVFLPGSLRGFCLPLYIYLNQTYWISLPQVYNI